MEVTEVRLARLEEGMVSVKGDTSHIRTRLDILAENHWKLSGRVVGIAMTLSVTTTVLTTIALRLLIK